ncbi:MAG: hypothetical protein K2K96_07365 [Lachnospiraceae bacterium]|nr:hypothetical protein [Lachnospiraceae bacterium]
MYVNELAGTIHQTHYPQHVVSLPHMSRQITASSQEAEVDPKTREFSDILSDYVADAANEDNKEILTAIKDLSDSIESLKKKNYDNQKTDVMSILTDQEKAKEYLSHQSGRELIIDMVENSIAGIISGTNI